MVNDVVDYFRWRNEDARRNALNGHCYWNLRERGYTPEEATQELIGMSVAQKNEFLFQRGINFNDLPTWQKRGIGIYWEVFEKEAWKPKTQTPVVAQRRRLKVDYDLPMRDEYSEFIRGVLENSMGSSAKSANSVDH